VFIVKREVKILHIQAQGIPGPNDDVIIMPQPPSTLLTLLVTGIPAGTVVHGLTLGPGGTLGGTLFGEPVGDLTVTATFNWTGGRLVVPLTVPVGGAVSISGADTTLTTAGLPGAGALNLAGTTTLSGALNVGGFDGPAFINNTGTFTAQTGASMNGLACCQNPSRFQNSGILVNDSGSSTTPISFMELANTGTIQLTSGVLRVNFPTASPSSNTSFTQPNGALVQIIIGGTRPGLDFGQLQVSASATLGGTLIATNATGFTPTPGQTFRVITCGVACNGTFTNVMGNYSAQYHPQDVTLIPGSSPPDSDLGLTNLPTNLTVNATSPQGATVAYTPPTVVDEDSPLPPVNCTPASGSTFAIGTTTVTCTVSDSDDTPSSVSQSFTVTVNGAATQVSDLITTVNSFGLPADIQAGFDTQLYSFRKEMICYDAIQ
jgi:HYR domain